MTNPEKANILVVDDLEEKLLVYRTILEGLGQNVVTARSGREALRHLLEKEFAVILLDVNMPEMDGLETAAMIRKRPRTAGTPIIFVTAFSDEMNTAAAYSLGAVDYILTPIVPEILRTKVGVFVDLYEKTQQVKRQAEQRVALARAEAAREAAEEARRRSAFLAEASTVLVRSLDSEAIPRELARQAVPFLGDLCAVTLAAEENPAGWKTELAWIGPPESRCTQTVVTGDSDLGELSARIQRVLSTGRPEHGPAITSSPLDPDAQAATRGRAGDVPRPGFAPHSILVVPLCAQGRTLGTIAVGRRDPRCPYGPEDLALAEDLAGRAAIALDNARLYRDVQENNRRKNEFLAMLAHELRNPLAPIRNAVEILRMLQITDPNIQWANDVIARQVEHLVRLVDDLLDISRITGGKIQLRKAPVDVAVAVARAVETCRPLMDARRHELSVTLPPQPLRVDADLVRLAQVLANLLNNAAKYTEEGGQIMLEVARAGDQAVFRVRDNGIGIAPEIIASVFDLFTQIDRSLNRSQGGLGVGLTLVRQLVEMHGGTVEAHSEGPNRGSEFVVRLPALAEESTSPGGADSRLGETRNSVPRRVLVIEDNQAAAESLRTLLTLGGHEVRVCPDGPGALEELTHFRPEIILLDLALPGMDGYEIARSIRRRPGTESIVLIALTGYGRDEDRRRSAEAGIDYHLTKPVDPPALLSLIASAPAKLVDTAVAIDPPLPGVVAS